MENEAIKEERATKHYPSIVNVPIELSKSPNLALTIVEKGTTGDFVNIQLNQQLIIEHLLLKRGTRFFLRSDGTLESGEELNTCENVVGVLKLDEKGMAFMQTAVPTNAMLRNSAKEEGIALEEGSKVVLEDNSYLVVGEIKDKYVKVILHKPEGEAKEIFIDKGGVALIGNTNIADINAGAEKFEGAIVMDSEGKVSFVKAENEMVINGQGYVLGKQDMFYLDGKMLKEIENEKFIVVTDSYALVFKKEEAKEQKAEEKKEEIKEGETKEEVKKEVEAKEVERKEEAEKKEAQAYLIVIARPEQLKEAVAIVESKLPVEAKAEAIEKLNAQLLIIKQDLVEEAVAVPIEPLKEGVAEQKAGSEGGVQVFERRVAPDTKVENTSKEIKAVVVEVRKEGLKENIEGKVEKPAIICSPNVLSFLKKNENYAVKVLLGGGGGAIRLRKMLASMIKDGFFIFLKR
ncbi:MAG: hypothetical protein QW035_04585 [Candidatus Anstonellales archaeon]